MKTKLLVIGVLLLASPTAFGFGNKKMNLTEIKGVTEAQLSQSADARKLNVMVRGRAAELLYRTLKEERKERLGSEALEWVGDLKNTHWTVKGRQLTCSRILNKASKKEDYACAFEMDPKGNVAAEVEPFSPGIFDLTKTKTTAKLFKGRKKGRGLASAAAPAGPFPASAYVMYDNTNKAKHEKPNYQDSLIVFKGVAAQQIMGFLNGGENFKEFVLAGAKGVKGKEISCVEATGGEPARCALVVGLKDGFVSTRKNPLFR